MKKYSVIFSGVWLCLFSVVALSANDEGLNNITQSAVEQTPISQTQVIESQAALWRLEVSEYERYLTLMSGPLGKWNKDLDPLMALGMFPDNPQDERRYAELYAQQEFELTERVLHFQQAYRVAFNRLYPFVGMLDQRLLAPYFENELLQTQSLEAARNAQQLFLVGDRLLLFVPLDCGRCLSTISHLMGLLSEINQSGVDIYVREAQDEEAVQAWSVQHQIQAQWISDEALTVSRDDGLYRRLSAESSTPNRIVLPIFLQRNEQFLQLDPQNLGL